MFLIACKIVEKLGDEKVQTLLHGSPCIQNASLINALIYGVA